MSSMFVSYLIGGIFWGYVFLRLCCWFYKKANTPRRVIWENGRGRFETGCDRRRAAAEIRANTKLQQAIYEQRQQAEAEQRKQQAADAPKQDSRPLISRDDAITAALLIGGAIYYNK